MLERGFRERERGECERGETREERREERREIATILSIQGLTESICM